MPPTTRAEATSSTPSNGVSILFVCLGNICRSPMAEAHFRHLTSFSTTFPHPLISKIDSCGTGAYHLSAPPDPRTLSVLAAHNIHSYTHLARKIRVPQDFKEFDYVLAMDEENVADLEAMVERAVKKGGLRREEVEGKVRLYGSFGGKGREEVGDPYYGGGEGFEVAWEQMGRFARGLVWDIEGRGKGERGEEQEGGG
ncbi:Low molecular weight phosphotyrosine protein phosphatase [Extremus antarcticus]|uniref:Low molecular weight phosphotyrosine protein phosphatase n=1 Tax=Extremus antarcticus TaxID=702011 RepID=A0AAJ0GDW7_9PEZI|nr:Low molecular weight phosphotyrosine protein phosphatase [Extremus antarcticus]